MDIEIPIGTTLHINGYLCEVVESSKCSICEVQKATSKMKYHDGRSMKCGTNDNSNTSWFACSKETRVDKKNIIFRRVI